MKLHHYVLQRIYSVKEKGKIGKVRRNEAEIQSCRGIIKTNVNYANLLALLL